MNRPSVPPSTSDGDLAAVARAAGALALIGASVALALEQSRGRWVTAFTSANTSNPRQRAVLLLGVAAGVVIGLSVTAVLWALGRARPAFPRLSRVVALLAPLFLVGFVPGLLSAEAWPDPLTFSVVLAGFLLLLERLFRLHFEAYADAGGGTVPGAARPLWPEGTRRLRQVAQAWADRLPPVLRRRWPGVVVGAAAAAYTAYMAFYVVRNHHRFNTFTWDLGQIDNQFYNFLHGHPFRCPALIREGNWSELRNHAEATMFFLLPIYALHPAAETLLVMQAVLLGAAGIPLYRFAARHLPRSSALVLLGAYYFYPPLHGAQFFDIHFQPLAAAFLLAALDFFDERRMRWFAVFFILAIGCREDISVGTAFFGLFLIFTGHRARAGLTIFLVSAAYFVLLRFVVMPAAGTWGFADTYRLLFPEGEGTFAGIIKTLLTNPVFTLTTMFTRDKLRYLLQILLPLAFLPVRSLPLAMSLLPGAFFTLLTTEYGATLSIGYQYSGYFIPYIFPAAALALQALGRIAPARRRAAVATLIAATIITTNQWGAIPPRRDFHSAYGVVSFEPPTPAQVRRLHDIRELDRMVPKSAILAVSDREMPHVSNRVECWNVSVGFEGADYILYTNDQPIPTDRMAWEAALRAGWVRVAERPGLVLLKRPGL
jgi:uncharacterized membrane protein